jgi:hypothetical protein
MLRLVKFEMLLQQELQQQQHAPIHTGHCLNVCWSVCKSQYLYSGEKGEKNLSQIAPPSPNVCHTLRNVLSPTDHLLDPGNRHLYGV